ncbi:MAG: hypothetical protein UR93_C0001G0030 [Berkelbacteria bacterium GW2011_GWA2_35_9]|uniref:Uncharacterized protein n=1 Tax=Berkelbacteria bacterium GW2011_GWA2_35_9 TaxID=1618333 RepID=A0A0G0D7F4_9BACT|nr:MAG: hypothetical protein UR93_C0001G0030 [Berkelbacteria bacterium GW2011_GWA2_35_9]
MYHITILAILAELLCWCHIEFESYNRGNKQKNCSATCLICDPSAGKNGK